MIKGIIIASYKSGGVLFQRYYGRDLSTVSAQARFLQKVRDTTAIEWPALIEEGSEECAYADGMHITYKLMGDVVVTVVGVDEHDQMLLLEFCRAFEAAIKKVLKIKPNTDVSMELRILQSYSKVCMVVEEMIIDGDIDHLDANMIAAVIKM